MEVEILGKAVRVNCPKGQEDALLLAASTLNQRLLEMKERTNIVNVEQLLTIVALNTCYELQVPSQEQIKETEAIEQKARHLCAILDKVITQK